MQITVNNQDLNAIIGLIDDEFNRLDHKEDLTRAVALNSLRVRLEQQSTPTSTICPVCQEITCDWDCPNPQGRAQEERFVPE
ncbi:MAG: hypothetical protein DRQ56_03555 [Gammaproteobacteria bacterium]|nr:MAG: hypothetical protein DRQ56_03555 [Gammaproteobacteria bacterium]